jgi:hypothetical protein
MADHLEDFQASLTALLSAERAVGRLEGRSGAHDGNCSPETCACFAAGLRSVLAIRCTKHFRQPPLNRMSAGGGECPICHTEALAQDRDQYRAQLAAVLALWPHIEVPSRQPDRHTVDPGPPTCLRCKIEETIATAQRASGEAKE